MARIRKLRTALAAVAATAVIGAVAPTAQAAEWEPPALDGTVTITVSTWWGSQKVVTPTQLGDIIASPGVYTAYNINLDEAETDWAAHGGYPMLMYGFPGAPNEVYQSFAAAGEDLDSLAGTTMLWNGCVRTRTPLSAPATQGAVSVHAGTYCH